jgi:hypothetical protein
MDENGSRFPTFLISQLGLGTSAAEAIPTLCWIVDWPLGDSLRNLIKESSNPRFSPSCHSVSLLEEYRFIPIFLVAKRSRPYQPASTMPASDSIPPIALPFVSDKAKKTLDLVYP